MQPVSCLHFPTYAFDFNLTHPLRNATRGKWRDFKLAHPLLDAIATLYIAHIIFYAALYTFTDTVYLFWQLHIYCIGFTLNHFYLLVQNFQ